MTTKGTKFSAWSAAEVLKLRQLRDVKKLEWDEIAKQLPGRTTAAIYFKWKTLHGYSRKKKRNRITPPPVPQNGIAVQKILEILFNSELTYTMEQKTNSCTITIKK